MHANITYPLACISDYSMVEGLLSVISAGCGQLVKMFITYEPHGIFDQMHTYLF